MNKKQFRAHAAARRDRLSPAERKANSRVICDAIMPIIARARAKHIMLYNAFGSEVDLGALIPVLWHAGMHTYFPVMDGRRIHAVPFNSRTKYKAAAFGIREPVGEPADPALLDICLIPGVAFTRSGHRLGYGVGYYDRFLPQTQAQRIGVCFAAQLFSSLPVDEHDCIMDTIINETACIPCERGEAITQKQKVTD